jgi:enoyl-CoA hydratase
LAEELAAKPPIAMRLNKQRFREVTEAGFRDCLEAGIRTQREAFGTGEPARMMEEFFAARSAAKRNH